MITNPALVGLQAEEREAAFHRAVLTARPLTPYAGARERAQDRGMGNLTTTSAAVPSCTCFGAGLTEAEVRRLEAIIRDQCGRDVALPAAWSRAIELLSLVEMLLESRSVSLQGNAAEGVRAPSLLTDSGS